MKAELLTLLVIIALFALMLAGCDTNGYETKSTTEHPRYCPVSEGDVTVFIPCNELKHDTNI